MSYKKICNTSATAPNGSAAWDIAYYYYYYLPHKFGPLTAFRTGDTSLQTCRGNTEKSDDTDDVQTVWATYLLPIALQASLMLPPGSKLNTAKYHANN